jgi:hypothetical protein
LFKFHDGSINVRLSSIRLKIGRIKEDEIVIHDSFFDREERFLFLVSNTSDKLNFSWLSEKQLQACRNKDFSETIFEHRNKYMSNKNTDNILSSCDKKARTRGILIASSNCGIVTGFKEIFGSESLSQVSAFCCGLIDYYDTWPKYLVYDNSCKLRKYVKESNDFNRSSSRAQTLIETSFVVDRFHFESHSATDTYCKDHCDANKYEELVDINTSVSEEINFWFSGYKHLLKHMNYERFHFLIFILFDEFNNFKLSKMVTKQKSK